MLNQVLEIVQDRGWFDLRSRHEKSIFLSQGASLWMVLSRDGEPRSFVKFSDLVGLAEEARRCENACAAYPDHAPTFVGYARQGPLDVLATGAVSFRPVTTGMTRAGRESDRIAASLLAYFKVMGSRARDAAAAAARQTWTDDLIAHFAGSDIHRAAVEQLVELAPRLMALPSMPQHGDLVMNNLGLKGSGALVIFDWEDFGSVDLPGLDLFTLEYSFAVEAGLRLGKAPWPQAPRGLDSRACCAALGLDPALHARMRLVHALVFRYLKRNYGPEVQSRLDRLIADLSPD